METVKQRGGNGVRLYFGAYPVDHAEQPEYAGRQTIVLVATKTREEEGKLVHKQVYTNDGGKAKILAYNNGTMCPPFCPTPGLPPPGGLTPGTAIIDRGEKGMTIV
jgi:hypothetical protein